MHSRSAFNPPSLVGAFLTKVGVRIGKEPLETFLESRSEFAKGKWSEIETERRKFFAGEGDADGPNFFSPEDCLKLLKKVP